MLLHLKRNNQKSLPSLEDYITQFKVDVGKLHFRAEEEQNWAFVTEANPLKKIANEERLFLILSILLRN